jgi:hypothetical protein
MSACLADEFQEQLHTSLSVSALVGRNNALPSCIHIAFTILVAGHDSNPAATN